MSELVVMSLLSVLSEFDVSLTFAMVMQVIRTRERGGGGQRYLSVSENIEGFMTESVEEGFASE